jgi:radical SAM superfamily enzyme YgiQ (UPF0313 family)
MKKQFPSIFQIYGGIHATLVPEILTVMHGLDALCVGYGEIPMLELVERIEKKKSILNIPGLWVRYRKNGRESITKNPPYFPESNHEELLAFDHNIFLRELSRFRDFDIGTFRLEIIFNRSCPFNCSFCCNHKLKKVYNNRKFTPSPEASINALKRCLQKTNLKFVDIHDDVFTLNKGWFREFIKRYADEVHLPFQCNLRADSFDEEDVKLLKKANIHSVWVGIESGNDSIRNRIMRKGITNERIINSIKLLQNYNILVYTQNIIGVPYETPDHFIDTIRINAECWPAKCHMLSIFYPYPKTDLYELSVRENLINERYGSVVERTSPVLNSQYFPEKKIDFYFRNFERLIKYQHRRIQRPYVFFIPLKDKTSWIIVKIMHILGIARKIIYKAVKLMSLERTGTG